MAPVRLARTVLGPAGGPTVILLHGSPINRWMWRPQADELVAAGYRVVLPDLRGHGESPVPNEASTMERCAADVFAMADELAIDRFVLGGLSFGGMVALEMVTSRPERVAALLLAATLAEPDSPRTGKHRLEYAEQIRREGITADVARLLPHCFTQETLVGWPALVDEVRAMMLNTPVEGRFNSVVGIVERRDYRPLLPAIRAPSLVIVRSEDVVTPPEPNKEIHKRIPGAFLQELEGAGHLCNMEAPEPFNQAMMNWLTFSSLEV